MKLLFVLYLIMLCVVAVPTTLVYLMTFAIKTVWKGLDVGMRKLTGVEVR